MKKAFFIALVLSSNFIWAQDSLLPDLRQFQTPVTLSAKVDDTARSGEVANVVVNVSMDAEW